MVRWVTAFGVAGLALLASCSAPSPGPAQPPRSTATSAPSPLQEPIIPALSLDGYKKAFAAQVARASPQTFDEPVPEMLKSVVVLDVTIGHDGRLLRVAVRRSNGYRALENLAMDSVRRAAPFAAPSFTVRRADGSVNFLETFLFRDDGRFRIRSLVAAR
jgi:protein TonB